MTGKRIQRKGFTLLEALLASTISLLLLGGLYVVVDLQVNSTQNSREAIQQATLARALMDRVARDMLGAITIKDPGPFRSGQLSYPTDESSDSTDTTDSSSSGSTGSTASGSGASGAGATGSGSSSASKTGSSSTGSTGSSSTGSKTGTSSTGSMTGSSSTGSTGSKTGTSTGSTGSSSSGSKTTTTGSSSSGSKTSTTGSSSTGSKTSTTGTSSTGSKTSTTGTSSTASKTPTTGISSTASKSTSSGSGSTSSKSGTSGSGSSTGGSGSSSGSSSTASSQPDGQKILFIPGVVGVSDQITTYQSVPLANLAAGNSINQATGPTNATGTSGIRRVSYWVVGQGDQAEGLARWETTSISTPDAVNPQTMPSEPQSWIIAPEVRSLKISYSDGTTGNWSDNWDSRTLSYDSATPQGPPRAIKIELKMVGGDGVTIRNYSQVVAIPVGNTAPLLETLGTGN